MVMVLFKKRVKKMNSKLIALAVAGLVGLSASADVLYWQVNDTAAQGTGLKGTPETAYLKATATGDSASPYYVLANQNASGTDVSTGSGGAVDMSTFANGGYAAGVLDAAKILSWADNSAYGASGADLSALSFFVELYDASGNWVGQTTPQTYQSLVDSGAISSGLNPNFSGVNSAVGGGSGSYSVPEPTSGLLMLVGLGALALRRRKVA